MLAEEAHYMGEPCWHAVQYYERLRSQRLLRQIYNPRRPRLPL